MCRNKLSALEGEEHTSKVGDFDQAQALVYGIEAESEAILRKVDDDGRLERSLGGEGEIDLGKGACVSLELGQDVEQGGAQDCERRSDRGEIKEAYNGNHVPIKPSE